MDELPDGLGYVTGWPAALEYVAGETFLEGVFSDETQVLILARVKRAERYILQCEKVVVARRSVQLLHSAKTKQK